MKTGKIDWQSVLLCCVLVALISGSFGYFGYASERIKGLPPEDKIEIEELSYKGHQYLIFKGKRLLDDAAVLHSPDCKCKGEGE